MSHHEDGDRRHKKWSEWPRGTRIAVMAAAAVVFVPGLLALFGAVTMWLWNWLMPTIFKLPAIGFWQAVGILLLSQLLFRGCQVGRAGRGRWKKERIRQQMGEEAPEAKAE